MNSPNRSRLRDTDVDRAGRAAAARLRLDVDARLDLDTEWKRFERRASGLTPTTAADLGVTVDAQHSSHVAQSLRRRRALISAGSVSMLGLAAASALIMLRTDNDPTSAPTASTRASVPPTERISDLPTVLDRLGASFAVTSDPSGVTTWANGKRLTTFGGNEFTSYQWLGDLLIRQVTDAKGLRSHSTAFDVTATAICEADGQMYRIRRPAGRAGWVASVTRIDQMAVALGEIPTYAVDCSTGEQTVIASAASLREGGGTGQLYIGQRQFVADYDAEGNAKVVNEQGRSVNGTDLAGLHTFSADGSLVAYADFTDASGPFATRQFVVADTTTGEARWRGTVDAAIADLFFLGDRVVVETKPESAVVDATPGPVTLNVFEVADGTPLSVIETPAPLLHLSVDVPPVAQRPTAASTP